MELADGLGRILAVPSALGQEGLRNGFPVSPTPQIQSTENDLY